jgi:dolichyl-phosphate-mannose--protein O-mannosyl transferase
MQMFGSDNPFGWRFMPAVFGITLVAIIIAIAYRLFRSVGYASLAGLLLAVDGHAIVLSQTAMLDIFLAVFAAAGTLFLLLDRDQQRERFARLAAAGEPATVSWRRGWVVAAAAMFGFATGVKIIGVVFFAIFALYLVVGDLLRLRSAGVRSPLKSIAQAGINAVYALPAFLGAYLLGWTGWFLSDTVVMRHSSVNPTGLWALVPEGMRSLVNFQYISYKIESSINVTNAQASPGLTWPMLLRPVAFYRDQAPDGTVHLIDTLGNPLIWWVSLVAVFVVIRYALKFRDHAAAFISLGMAAGWGPWLFTGNRTVYQYYAITFLPFMILALVYVVKSYRERSVQDAVKNRRSLVVLGAAAVLAVVMFLLFLPQVYGLGMSEAFWSALKWLPSWDYRLNL